MDDYEAYRMGWQEDRWVYDKAKVALVLGHKYGKDCIPEDEEGNFVVRPVMNFDGGGKFAYKVIGKQKGFEIAIPKGFFWQEEFHGEHTTLDFTRVDGKWVPSNYYQGIADTEKFQRFKVWYRKAIDPKYCKLPEVFHGVTKDKINIEMIGGKIIEVHLRHNTDPVEYSIFYPIWEDDPFLELFEDRVEISHGLSLRYPGHSRWCFIKDKVNHEGRVGFVVKYNEYIQRNKK